MSTELGPLWLATEKSEMFGGLFSLSLFILIFSDKNKTKIVAFFF